MTPSTWIQALHRWTQQTKVRPHWVGGTVRDILRGRIPPDWDMALQTPEEKSVAEVQEHFAAWVQSRGETIFTTRKQQPACRWMLTPNRWVDVMFFQGPLENELLRRDFTVNAMAIPWNESLLPFWQRLWIMEVLDTELPSYLNRWVVDPVNGRADLARGIIRVVADQNLQTDPVRVLRAYRLAAQMDWTIEPTTRQALRSAAHLLTRVPGERLVVELLKWLQAPHADEWVEAADEDGVWDVLIPEATPMKGCEQGGYHHLDVWHHSLAVFQAIPKVIDAVRSPRWARTLDRYLFQETFVMGFPLYPFLRLTALLHDIGKPAVRREKRPGVYTFHGHGPVGARIAEAVLIRWRMARRAQRWIGWMIQHHLAPLHFWKTGGTERAVYTLTRRFRDQAPWLMILSTADQMGKAGPWMESNRENAFIQMTQAVMDWIWLPENRSRWVFPLRGRDLMEALGAMPGPTLGWILQRLRRDWEQGRFHRREELLQRARQLMNSLPQRLSKGLSD